jgi:hypothetical protein
MEPRPKFVILRGILEENLGGVFWTRNDPSPIPVTQMTDGTEAYAVVGYANTPEEAMDICQKGFV